MTKNLQPIEQIQKIVRVGLGLPKVKAKGTVRRPKEKKDDPKA